MCPGISINCNAKSIKPQNRVYLNSRDYPTNINTILKYDVKKKFQNMEEIPQLVLFVLLIFGRFPAIFHKVGEKNIWSPCRASSIPINLIKCILNDTSICEGLGS